MINFSISRTDPESELGPPVNKHLTIKNLVIFKCLYLLDSQPKVADIHASLSFLFFQQIFSSVD